MPVPRDTSIGRLALLLAGFILLATGLLGCRDAGESEDKVVVDFRDTRRVGSRNSSADRERKVLRAAAGAMVSPQETYEQYRELFAYVSRKLDRELVFEQRQTYAEVNELLAEDELDLAFICSGPYALARQRDAFELLAAPWIDGSARYRSYLIVARDSGYQSLRDLEGASFAFTDPDSNTGHLVPLYWLSRLDADPETFFQKTIYTYSHDNSILAVARGLVDGAAVDSLIWDYLRQNGSDAADRTRVLRESRPFGIPPVVVSSDMEPGLKERIGELLLRMHTTPEGRSILDRLHIDRFIVPKESWYDPIRAMEAKLREEGLYANSAAKP
ncbi:MAG: phosphate/phosphite/phosphonate ABC transporter substrate-binding protein [Desulfohalobiaceae bacterium]